MKHARIIFGCGLWLALTAAAWSQAPAKAYIATVSGSAEYATKRGAERQTLRAGATVPIGSVIYTGEKSVVQVRPYPGAAFRINPKSEITIVDLRVGTSGNELTSRKTILDIKKGALGAVLVTNPGPNHVFEVRTPQGVVAARGTIFALAIGRESKSDSRTYVGLKKGKVDCRARYISTKKGNLPST